MEIVATAGYLTCMLAFLGLSIVLRSSWKGDIHGALAILASVASLIWAATSSYTAYFGSTGIIFFAGELLRDGFWIAFLFLLIRARTNYKDTFNSFAAFAVGLGFFIFTVVGVLIYSNVTHYYGYNESFLKVYFICLVLLSCTGLLLIEQLFRNTPMDQRWAIKFFCIGVGGLFAYDFYLYSDALLFERIDEQFWGARGFVNVLVVPLIVISAARNPDWTLPLHVSRRFVFHTASLIGAGFYLIAMAVGGYYVKLYGGSWGMIAQIIFLFGALVLLGILLSSGNVRAKLKVYLSKNFFNYKYDYREEWLRLMATMSEQHSSQQIKLNAVKAIADIVESAAGMLWIKDQSGQYNAELNWNMESSEPSESEDSSFIRFLKNRFWIIDVNEYDRTPELYGDLQLPAWLQRIDHAWLVLPLIHQADLWGFVVLGKPRAAQKINWEDRDLLFTAGRQVASYLALLQANEALFQARQFEAFNRLSAYVVHDLKNIVAQLSLIVTNAVKHKHNPAFMEDAFHTVENATNKMNKLLSHLRKGRLDIGSNQEQLNLIYLLKEAIARRNVDSPKPKLCCSEEEVFVLADYDRLLSVLEHLIQNAQHATPNMGQIDVTCSRNNGKVAIDIEDTGCGMSEEFVRERLFKPFQTTKGNAGMGIGVYESREYITAMGGTMSVRSAVDKGTTFTIQLPLARMVVNGETLSAKMNVSL